MYVKKQNPPKPRQNPKNLLSVSTSFPLVFMCVYTYIIFSFWLHFELFRMYCVLL